MEFKIKIGDILFTAALVFIVLATMIPLFFAESNEKNATVHIEIANSQIAVRPLSQDSEVEIKDVGTVIIKDNKVYVKDIDCKDKLCSHMGPISKSYQTIICLPNKMIIRIVDGSDDFDGISG